VAGLAVAVLGLLGASAGLLWARYAADEEARRTEEGLLRSRYEISEKAREDAEQARLELEKTLAGERIAHAQAHYNGNEAKLTQQLLDQVPEPYRDEHWLALHRECHAEVAKFAVPPPNHGRFVLSPDGSRLATFRPVAGQSVLLLDTRTRERVGAVPTPTGLADAAFGPDGRTLVGLPVVSAMGVQSYQRQYQRQPSDVVTTWDLSNLRPVSQWGLGIHEQAAVSPDGRRLATYSAGRVRVWDSATGDPIAEIPHVATGTCMAILFDPAGRRVALLLATRIQILDVPSRRLIHTIPLPHSPIPPAIFSPDGNTFASLTSLGGTAAAPAGEHVLTLWDLERGRELRQLRRPARFLTAAFSPDGKHLALNDMTAIHLLEISSGNRLATLRGHPLQVTQVAFTPDGRQLHSTSPDYIHRIWDLRSWID
jgi:hypothetical protein